MIEFIKTAVSQNPDLSLKFIQGGHHRIMKSGWYGSLWIIKTATRGYRVETTGSVATNLNPEISILLGRDNDIETDRGYKGWFVEKISDVEKIINSYGRI